MSSQYEAILKATENSSSINQRDTCLASLGSIQSPDLLTRTLEFSLTPEIVSRLEVEVVLRSFPKHKLGKTILWEWTKANLERIRDTVGHGIAGFKYLITIILGGLSTRAQWEDVKSFFEEKDTETYNVLLEQGLDSILTKARWLERDGVDVEEWLKANGYMKYENEESKV